MDMVAIKRQSQKLSLKKEARTATNINIDEDIKYHN